MAENLSAASQETQRNQKKSSTNVGWTQQQKKRLVELDKEERAKGKGFMDRVKKRWEVEFPNTNHSAKNLAANARIFKKKINEEGAQQQANAMSITDSERTSCNESNVNWVTDMKVRLVELDKQARAEGRGFMARLKSRWDEEFKEYRHLDAQCLRDNASRFNKEQSIANLLLVRERSACEPASEEEERVITQREAHTNLIEDHEMHDLHGEKE